MAVRKGGSPFMYLIGKTRRHRYRSKTIQQHATSWRADLGNATEGENPPRRFCVVHRTHLRTMPRQPRHPLNAPPSNFRANEAMLRHGGTADVDYRPLRPAGFALPVTRGGRPVCWVRMRPFVGWADLAGFADDTAAALLPPGVEFLRRALW